MVTVLTMLTISVTALVVSPVAAISWEFAATDGDQGWHARDGQCAIGYTCPPLRAMASEGVWLVWAIYNENAAPIVELVSPRLGYPAALFDRLEVRFRVVHPDPLTGQIGLYWRCAPEDAGEGGADEWWSQFYEPPMVLTGAWQTVTVTDIPEHAMTAPDGWSGELREVRIRFVLSNAPSLSAADVPEVLEIDRIRLTGMEEQFAGELPPPDPGARFFGSYFAEPALYPLKRGAGRRDFGLRGSGSLADLDGDGLLDLVAGRGHVLGGGWMYALNDGAGGFTHPRFESIGLAGEHGDDRVAVTDLNGDGLADVVVMDRASAAQILYNAGDGAWVEGEAFDHHYYLGAGDMDGDGDEDLWFVEHDPDPISLMVLVAGTTPSLRREMVRMEPHGMGLMLSASPLYLVGNLTGAGMASVLIRPPFDFWSAEPGYTFDHEPFSGYRIMRWQDAGFVEESIGIAVNPALIQTIGDLNGDGDIDFVVSDTWEVDFGPARYLGLTLVAGRSDGSYRWARWLEDVTLHRGPQQLKWMDLDGDGILDVAFADHASSGPTLIVCAGQSGVVLPFMEGRYELGGMPEEVLPGDVDADGDVDLVVLESTHGTEGGVEVFLNRVGDAGTAVMEPTRVPLPQEPALGACYPNPFNAGIAIPITVPADRGAVRLTICNVLGQPVRVLVDAALPAGTHTVAWDGRDDRGHDAGTGTYICRLEVAGLALSRKLTKLE